MRDREIAVVGYSETKIELRSGRSVFDLAGEAMAGVLEQTGLDRSIIDGLALASYKKPKYVCVVDELPKNSSGKTLKYRLRDSFAAGSVARPRLDRLAVPAMVPASSRGRRRTPW